MKQKHKKNLASNLIFYTLITTSIVSILTLAKFQSTTSKNSNAQIAIYAMNAESVDETVGDLNIDCAGDNDLQLTDDCSYTVTNNVNGKVTEVSIKYKIKIQLEEELPTGITINVVDKNNIVGKPTKFENAYIFENEEWVFDAGVEGSNTINITFIGENISGATSTMISGVQVSIIAEQID